MSVLVPAPFSPMRAWTSPGQIRRSTFLRARTPGKLLVIPRTSRIGRSSLSPTFVLVDIFFRDQIHRNEGKCLLRLLPIYHVVANLDSLARHGVGILRGGCSDQATRILQGRNHVRCSVHAHDEEILPL